MVGYPRVPFRTCLIHVILREHWLLEFFSSPLFGTLYRMSWISGSAGMSLSRASHSHINKFPSIGNDNLSTLAHQRTTTGILVISDPWTCTMEIWHSISTVAGGVRESRRMSSVNTELGISNARFLEWPLFYFSYIWDLQSMVASWTSSMG